MSLLSSSANTSANANVCQASTMSSQHRRSPAGCSQWSLFSPDARAFSGHPVTFQTSAQVTDRDLWTDQISMHQRWSTYTPKAICTSSSPHGDRTRASLSNMTSAGKEHGQSIFCSASHDANANGVYERVPQTGTC
jgi:hypothetical protein